MSWMSAGKGGQGSVSSFGHWQKEDGAVRRMRVPHFEKARHSPLSDGIWQSYGTVISDQVNTRRDTPFEVVPSGDGVASEWCVGVILFHGVSAVDGAKTGKHTSLELRL